LEVIYYMNKEFIGKIMRSKMLYGDFKGKI